MPAIELTEEELTAIATACMVVNEHVRVGRKQQKAYIELDGDSIGAEFMATAMQKIDAARATLRGLIARHMGVSNADD